MSDPDLFQKSKDVNSVSVSEFNSNNNNNLPPDYIDLDNFKSEKIEEFNKKADEKKVEEKKANENKANLLNDINNFEINNPRSRAPTRNKVLPSQLE